MDVAGGTRATTLISANLRITSELPVLGTFQDTSRGSGRDEFLTPNRVVRDCELLVIGLRLFLGKIDHDDLRVFAQAVEDDLFSVAGDVEGPHGGTVLQPGEGARLHRGEIE
jgi:hypothetical protein